MIKYYIGDLFDFLKGAVAMKESFSIYTADVSVEYKLERTAQEDSGSCHDEFELVYICDGFGKYIVEGSEYRINPRTVFVMRPLEYHRARVDSHSPYERYSIRFSKSALSGEALSMLEKIAGEDGGSGNYYPAGAVAVPIFSVFDRFETAELLPELERRAYVKALLSEIIILLSAVSGERMIHAEDELGARAIRYLNGNMNKNISLDELAKHFFVSKYYLCRAFKRHNGISVHSYLNRKRIMYAKQLIESGETASRAAYLVGFGDYSAFYRAYVKVIGRSPTAEADGKETV